MSWTRSASSSRTIRAEVRGLEEVDRAFATATPALAWVLASENRVPGLIGPVTDAIAVDPEVEKAVEIALGGDLFCVLVSDAAARGEVLRLLGEHAAGDISILAVDAVHISQIRAGVGRRLSDAVTCDDRVRPAIDALLGDVYLLPSLEEALDAARRFPGLRFATPEGHMAWPSGKVTLGPTLDPSASVLTRKRCINELRDDESAAASRVGEAEALLAEAEEAVGAAQQDALELGQRLAAQTGENDSLREEVGRLERALTDLENESRAIVHRTAVIAERTAKDHPAKVELAARIEQTGPRRRAPRGRGGLEARGSRQQVPRRGRYRQPALDDPGGHRDGLGARGLPEAPDQCGHRRPLRRSRRRSRPRCGPRRPSSCFAAASSRYTTCTPRCSSARRSGP